MSTATSPVHSATPSVGHARGIFAAIALALALTVAGASTIAMTTDDSSASSPTAGKKYIVE